MKKRQSVKKIKPGNPYNAWIAIWGRLADSDAAYVYASFSALARKVLRGPGPLSPALKQEKVRVLNTIASSVLAALIRRKGQFFRDLAEIVEDASGRGLIAPASLTYLLVIRLMRGDKGLAPEGLGPVSQWTRSQLLDFLRDRTGEIIDERTLSRIIKATGVQLRPSKRGPPGRRRPRRN